MWGRVFQRNRPGSAWYTEGQAVSPQHDWGWTWLEGQDRELAGELDSLGKSLRSVF